jgi:DNA-binding transcriptional MocR family regulator
MTELQGPEQVLYDLLAQHESLGPKQAADALGWNKDQVAQAKEGLKAKGLISTRQGGGMQVAEPIGLEANRPLSQQAPEPLGHKPKGSEAQGSEANKPEGQQANRPLSPEAPGLQAAAAKKPKATDSEPIEKQLWKTADKLRKNIDAAEYTRVVLGRVLV